MGLEVQQQRLAPSMNWFLRKVEQHLSGGYQILGVGPPWGLCSYYRGGGGTNQINFNLICWFNCFTWVGKIELICNLIFFLQWGRRFRSVLIKVYCSSEERAVTVLMYSGLHNSPNDKRWVVAVFIFSKLTRIWQLCTYVEHRLTLLQSNVFWKGLPITT